MDDKQTKQDLFNVAGAALAIDIHGAYPVSISHLGLDCSKSAGLIGLCLSSSGYMSASSSSAAPAAPTLSQLASAQKPKASAKRRILRQHDSDVKVTRAIRDNFGSLSLHARTAKLVEGLTLRATLKREFAKAKSMLAKTGGKKKGRQAKSVNIGEKEYSRIRKAFADSTDPEAALEVPREREASCN